MLFFDDLFVGYRSEVGSYKLHTQEVIAFAAKWDPQPSHVDVKAAEESLFGGLVASSLHLFAICSRLFFDHQDKIQVMAMLGKDEIRIPNPARAESVLTYHTECVTHTASRSKRDRGVIVLADEIQDQNQTTVLTQKVTLLVARQD